MQFEKVKINRFHAEHQIKFIAQAAQYSRRAMECLLTAAKYCNVDYKPMYKNAAQRLLYTLFAINKLNHDVNQKHTTAEMRLMYGGDIQAEIMRQLQASELQLTRKGEGVDTAEDAQL